MCRFLANNRFYFIQNNHKNIFEIDFIFLDFICLLFKVVGLEFESMSIIIIYRIIPPARLPNPRRSSHRGAIVFRHRVWRFLKSVPCVVYYPNVSDLV